MKRILLPLFLMLFSFLQLSGQEKVYLPFFETLNLHGQYHISATKLYKVYLESTGKYEVAIQENKGDGTSNESIKLTRENAEALEAKYFIRGELNKLGSIVIVSITMYSTENSQRVWGDYLKANSIDDLDPVLNKLASVTGTKKSLDHQSDIYGVTDYEAREINQKHVRKNIGATIGGAYPYITSEIDSKVIGGLGAMWSYDSGNLIFDIKGEAYLDREIDIYFLALDVIYPFTTKSHGPFALGGLGFGGMNSTPDDNFAFDPASSPSGTRYYENNAGGLMAFAGGGYILNRTSRVRLRITAKGFYGFYDLYNRYQPYGGMVGVAILFDSDL